ncbi:MAG: single-stranded-DNA-specific exonuclease RecJ [Moraxellaceae bacterium]|nr:single-stranded-DNA-specific exonuclease RecJ [Moraxellaceae bacterium]
MLNLTNRFSSTAELPKELQTLAKTNPTLARIYASRGVSSLEDLDFNLSNLLSAEDLLGIDKAVNLLDKALDEGKRILIVGDFDCDGATSTALMIRVLSAMGKQTGARIDFIVPDRFKYGYGLTPEIVGLGISQYQPNVIVTVDNGISSHEGVATAHQHGVEVIITDHHLTTKVTPPAEAVVNPNQLSCEFASKSLVGVGVAFYVLGRLTKIRRLANKSTYQVSKHLDLVALGTIADVGILDKNNRILVYHGLQAIRSKNCCMGILAILEQAGRDYQQLTSQDLGFIVAPRVNSAGRMDNMAIGIKCLLADDWQTAQALAQQLNTLNTERRSVEGQMREQADSVLQMIDNQSDNLDNRRSVVLYQDDWHQGVIGIVAGRIKEQHHCPAVVFAPSDTAKISDDDLIKGSARSINGIHIRDTIEKIADENDNLISHFGGHAMAGGLTIKRKNFNAFKTAFEQQMAQVEEEVFQEEKFTDGQLVAEDFSLSFADTLKQANIWGHGFVAPIFDGVFEVVNFRILKDKHLKLNLKYPNVTYPIDAIYFNYNSENWDYRASEVHILFELDINEWNGMQNLQLMVRDLAVVKCTP